MIRLAIVGALVALSGCCTIRAGSCDDKKYAIGWTHEGVAPPRCTDAVLAELEAGAPCPAAKGLHGVVFWYAKPFQCSMGQTVWGCSILGKPYVIAKVALPPNGHASDSALPEEVAHWVWQTCFPAQQRLEWWDTDPVTGKAIYVRDPAFKAWYDAARGRAREICR